jgi:peptidoglycan hydrolase CwlO-like protein
MAGEQDNTGDLTNRGLSKLFSIEILGLIIVSAFTIGTLYSQLSIAQAEQDHRMDGLEQEQRNIKRAVDSISTDTAVLRNEQAYIKEQVKEQREDIKRILQLIERNTGAAR